MNWSKAAQDILIFSAIGAAVGLVVGLLFMAADAAGNPFAFTGAGIFLGSMASLSRYQTWSNET